MKFSKVFSITVLSLLLGCSQPFFGMHNPFRRSRHRKVNSQAQTEAGGHVEQVTRRPRGLDVDPAELIDDLSLAVQSWNPLANRVENGIYHRVEIYHLLGDHEKIGCCGDISEDADASINHSPLLIDFSNDGKLIAREVRYADQGGKVLEIGELESGVNVICKIPLRKYDTDGGERFYKSISFAPDSEHVAILYSYFREYTNVSRYRYSISNSTRVFVDIWNVRTGNLIDSLKTFESFPLRDVHKYRGDSPESLSVRKEVMRERITRRNSLRSLLKMTGRLMFNQEGTRLTICFCLHGTVYFRLLDLKKKECVFCYNTPGSDVHWMTLKPIAFSSDNKYIACVRPRRFFDRLGLTNNLTIFDMETSKKVKSLKKYQVDILKFSPDDKYLVSGGQDGLVTIWKTSFQKESGWQEVMQINFRGKIRFLEFSPKGRYFVCEKERKIYIYDLYENRIVRKFPAYNICSIRFLQSEIREIVEMELDQEDRVQLVSEGLLRDGRELFPDRQPISFADGKRLFVPRSLLVLSPMFRGAGAASEESVSSVHTIGFSAQTTEELEEEWVELDDIATVVSPKDPNIVAVAYNDGTVEVMEKESSCQLIVLERLEANGGPIDSIAFSNGGTKLVVTSKDGVVETWDLFEQEGEE